MLILNNLRNEIRNTKNTSFFVLLFKHETSFYPQFFKNLRKNINVMLQIEKGLFYIRRNVGRGDLDLTRTVKHNSIAYHLVQKNMGLLANKSVKC